MFSHKKYCTRTESTKKKTQGFPSHFLVNLNTVQCLLCSLLFSPKSVKKLSCSQLDNHGGSSANGRRPLAQKNLKWKSVSATFISGQRINDTRLLPIFKGTITEKVPRARSVVRPVSSVGWPASCSLLSLEDIGQHGAGGGQLTHLAQELGLGVLAH